MTSNRLGFRFVAALITGVFFVLTGCAPVYIPNCNTTTYLKDKGEADVMLGYCSSGITAQAGYSPVKHVGIEMSASGISHKTGSGKGSEGSSLFEGGAGAYYFFADHYLASSYFGYGQGWGRNVDANFLFYSVTNEGHFTRLYARPAIGLLIKNAEFSLGWRFSQVDMRYDETDNLTNVHTQQQFSTLFDEPFLSMRAGKEHFKVGVQYGICFSNHDDGLSGYDFAPYYAGFTFSYHFSPPAAEAKK